FLEALLVLGNVLAGVAADEREQELPEAVALEVQLERHPRPALPCRLDLDGADRPDRPVDDAERREARRVVRRDLVRELARAARNLPQVGGARAHPRRALGLLLDADDLALPLAMALEVGDVGEDG